MGWKFPEIPRPHPIVHLHYLEHFGASENDTPDDMDLTYVFRTFILNNAQYSLKFFQECEVSWNSKILTRWLGLLYYVIQTLFYTLLSVKV